MMNARNLLTPYTVSYNSESHWSVITQMWGSQWPKVLPYCLVNVALMIFLKVLDGPFGYHMVEVSPQGHSFLTMVVAFLLVSRVNTGLARYNTARDSLGIMYKEVRELVQCAVVFSDTCLDTAAREWRHEVAYRCLILLRTSMVVIEYPESSVTPWQIQELNGVELEDIRNSLFINPKNHRWAHSERTIWEETMRVPIRIAYLIRKSVHSQTRRLSEQIQVTQENKLLANVDTFMVGFFGMKKFLTTPVPFPLIQMARTFMFLFVFTVPFAMLTDKSSHVAHCFMVFLLTYGFVGLEVVAIELDNPFGNDANDFKISAMAMTAYEDIYLAINDIDGPEWTDKLRARMSDKGATASTGSLEDSWLLSANAV